MIHRSRKTEPISKYYQKTMFRIKTIPNFDGIKMNFKII